MNRLTKRDVEEFLDATVDEGFIGIEEAAICKDMGTPRFFNELSALVVDAAGDEPWQDLIESCSDVLTEVSALVEAEADRLFARAY